MVCGRPILFMRFAGSACSPNIQGPSEQRLENPYERNLDTYRFQIHDTVASVLTFSG
jgi:hypothetical protein